MIRMVSNKSGLMTPEEAKELIRHVNPEKQRKFLVAHKDHLLGIMHEDDFYEGCVRTAMMPWGELRIADGQHTLGALAEFDKPIFIHRTNYECDDEADYRKLFHAFDTENRQRSPIQCARAFMQTGAIKDTGATDKMFNLARTGMEFAAKWGDIETSALGTKFKRFEATCLYDQEIRFLVELDELKIDRRLLGRAPVVAAIIATHSKHPKHAKPFWWQVVSGIYEVQGGKNPVVTLHRFLLETQLFATDGQRSGNANYASNVYTSWEFYKGIQLCWNAFATGTPLGLIKARGVGGLPGFRAPSISVPAYTKEQARAAARRED